MVAIPETVRESCRTMPLVSGFTQGSPVSPAPSFRCRSIFTYITHIGSQDVAVDSRTNLFSYSLKVGKDCTPSQFRKWTEYSLPWHSAIWELYLCGAPTGDPGKPYRLRNSAWWQGLLSGAETADQHFAPSRISSLAPGSWLLAQAAQPLYPDDVATLFSWPRKRLARPSTENCYTSPSCARVTELAELLLVPPNQNAQLFLSRVPRRADHNAEKVSHGGLQRAFQLPVELAERLGYSAPILSNRVRYPAGSPLGFSHVGIASDDADIWRVFPVTQ
ncbi:hypothetical protein PR048_031053 [Dryococelus australis]|uniref:Uncharacterized protein n=1 Tax=Dryococelus australis TaxID=614101 RepID=A0ABQ9G8A5_9NEOP|nr:hypothetical protein PR048_031053 [Dryococelus australis]